MFMPKVAAFYFPKLDQKNKSSNINLGPWFKNSDLVWPIPTGSTRKFRVFEDFTNASSKYILVDGFE